MEALYSRLTLSSNPKLTYASKRTLEPPNIHSGNISININRHFSSGSDEVHFAGGPNRAQLHKKAKAKQSKAARMEAREQSEANELEGQITDLHTIYDEDRTKTKNWLEDQIIDLLNSHPAFDINTPIRADLENKDLPKTPLLHFAVSKRFFNVADYILNYRDPDLTRLGVPCLGPGFNRKPLCIAQVAKLTSAYCKNRFGEEDDLAIACDEYADKIIKKQYEYEQSHPEQRTGYIRKNPHGQYILIGYDVESKEYVDSDSEKEDPKQKVDPNLQINQADTEKPLNARQRREQANKDRKIAEADKKKAALAAKAEALQQKAKASTDRQDQETQAAIGDLQLRLFDVLQKAKQPLLIDYHPWEKVVYYPAKPDPQATQAQPAKKQTPARNSKSRSKTQRTASQGGNAQNPTTSQPLRTEAKKPLVGMSSWPMPSEMGKKNMPIRSKTAGSTEKKPLSHNHRSGSALSLKTQDLSAANEDNPFVLSPSSTFVGTPVQGLSRRTTTATWDTESTYCPSPRLSAIDDEGFLFESSGEELPRKPKVRLPGSNRTPDELKKEIEDLKRQVQEGQARLNQQSAQTKKQERQWIQGIVDCIVQKHELEKERLAYSHHNAHWAELTKTIQEKVASVERTQKWIETTAQQALDSLNEKPKDLKEQKRITILLEHASKEALAQQEHVRSLRQKYIPLSTNPKDYVACPSAQEPGWGYFVKPGLFSEGTWVPKLPGD